MAAWNLEVLSVVGCSVGPVCMHTHGIWEKLRLKDFYKITGAKNGCKTRSYRLHIDYFVLGWATVPLLWFSVSTELPSGICVHAQFLHCCFSLNPIFLPFSSRQLMAENVKLSQKTVSPLASLIHSLSLDTAPGNSCSVTRLVSPPCKPCNASAWLLKQNFIIHRSQIPLKCFVLSCL